MKIKVKTVGGGLLEFDVEPNIMIKVLKEMVCQRVAVDPSQQRIMFRGQNLLDKATLQDAGVEDGTILQLVVSIIGG